MSIPEKARRLRRAVKHEMRYLGIPHRCKGSFSDDLPVQETLVPTVPTVKAVYACRKALHTTYLIYANRRWYIYSVHVSGLHSWLQYCTFFRGSLLMIFFQFWKALAHYSDDPETCGPSTGPTYTFSTYRPRMYSTLGVDFIPDPQHDHWPSSFLQPCPWVVTSWPTDMQESGVSFSLGCKYLYVPIPLPLTTLHMYVHTYLCGYLCGIIFKQHQQLGRPQMSP